MIPCTPRQLRCLSYVKAHIAANGSPPTLREIAQALGTVPGSVHVLLRRLQNAGHVRILPRRRRGIVIVAKERQEEEMRKLIRDLSVAVGRLLAPAMRVDSGQIMIDAIRLEEDRAAARQVLERVKRL